MPIGRQNLHLIFRGWDGFGYWLPEFVMLDLLSGFLNRKESLMYDPAPHALGKRYFLCIFAAILLFAVSYVTVYIPFFIISFFDKDEVMRKHFLKYHYRKY